MDIAAYALWAGAGAVLLARRQALPNATGFALVALAVLPDLMHALPDRAQPLPAEVESCCVR